MGACVGTLRLDPVSSAALTEEVALSLSDCSQGCAEASQIDVIKFVWNFMFVLLLLFIFWDPEHLCSSPRLEDSSLALF